MKKEAGGYNIYAPPHQQLQPHEGNPCLERLIPLSTESGAQMREGGPAAQPHPGQGSTQHVTMDNSGRGENISNTVGELSSRAQRLEHILSDCLPLYQCKLKLCGKRLCWVRFKFQIHCHVSFLWTGLWLFQRRSVENSYCLVFQLIWKA